MSAQLKIIENSATKSDLFARASALADDYCLQCGFRRLPWMQQEFKQLLVDGYEDDLLREIIARTARAPRPSWAYFSAIISSCKVGGIYDLCEFLLHGRRAYDRSREELPL